VGDTASDEHNAMAMRRAAPDRPVAGLSRYRRTEISRRRRRRAVLLTVLIGVGAAAYAWVATRSHLSPLRGHIVAIALGQVGYRTDPSDTYCNRFSAHFDSGTADCGNDDLDEEWCADFAAWVWQQAGAEVTYQFQPGDINSSSASFYLWGIGHGTWHAVGSGYVAQPGDVAIYGLDVGQLTATHVAVVVSDTPGDRGPNVVNGDGDRTGFSVVELGSDQYHADVKGPGEPLSGYVSPTAPPTLTDSSSG
jgi:hypothetical protein